MQGTWPLIEREQEFRTIQSALNPGGSVCGVVLTGDSGVGKTTLARLVTAGTETGVRWVAGTESARSIPLGVFAHLVGPAVSSDPVTYLSAARETLLAEGDTIIGVDDAHLLDELSATLLHQLAIDRAVQIVATVRSGEAVPDAVTSLWKDNHLIRITLSPFTKEQSVELIESVLGGQLEEHSADRMWEASGGNALFLRHLVEGARAARTLRQVNGVWQLRGRAAITSELASLLAGRVEQLQPDVLAALKYLSLCEPLDIDVLSDLASEEAVEQAEIDGLVRITRDGRSLNVSFHHPLFGEVIRHGLGLASSRRLRGALVRALDSRPKDTPAARIRLADLALESDVGAIDLSLLGSAARDALNLAQVPMGERFARAAIADGGGADEAELLARALMWQAQPDKAEQLLAQYRLADLDEIRATRIGVLRVGNMFWAMGDSKRADELLDEVRARVTEPLLTPIVDAIGSACALFENNLARAVELSDDVLAASSPLPWAVEWAAFGGMLARALQGRGDDVAPLAARARDAEAKTDGMLRFPAGIGEVLALTLTGRLEDAQVAAQRYATFADTAQYLGWAMAGELVAAVDLARGRCTAVTRRIEQTLATLDTDEYSATWNFPAYLFLIESLSAMGLPDDADVALTRAREQYGRQVAVFGPMLGVAAACQAASTGMITTAITLANDAAEQARETGQFAVEAESLHAAARFGDTSVADRLAELGDIVDGPLVGLYARHARASADGDGVELDLCAADFEKLGYLLSAADSAAQASVLHDNASHRSATVASAAMADRISASCGGLRTPALQRAAQPLPLTTREREIANLVAAGLSNKQIAERLVVSVRTVEGHIYRACVKLDVTDRADIAAILTQQRAVGT
ncbi:LuxR C-terminal-related transcriptional regulator [Gordonia sputi]|uniref:Putative LuxR family transcriptional regulator n=1 Tax=Gordonia sputi NBRC 100414 TaxID=1089453 RepID=H5TV79_9ACTN|nr:LuxR family transcriptional regulator [Gordonia sputi]NKY95475.1 helix-turn-helix domain-containing protein [Gordonia sputi]GAB37387.1 putative LuxR family transcriptional regulator [Gordonia sputi NBRC 100414]